MTSCGRNYASILKWIHTSGCWHNCVHKKSSITRCACRIPQRYCPAISVGLYEPYAVSASTLTFLSSLHMICTIMKILSNFLPNLPPLPLPHRLLLPNVVGTLISQWRVETRTRYIYSATYLPAAVLPCDALALYLFPH